MARVETGTADFTSTVTDMYSFTLTTGVDAAVVNLREATVGGTIRFIFKNVVAQTTAHFTFPKAATCNIASGNKQVWFVDLSSGTTPQMTITGE
jgi:hypothetical protein